MGWIAALFMAVFALIALAIAAGYHRREMGRLRDDHDTTLRDVRQKNKKRVDRLDRDFHRQLQAAHHPLVVDLLPALDSLDEALKHLQDDGDSAPNDDLLQGLEMARSALDNALNRHGIEAVIPEPGVNFDPTIHEAIARADEQSFGPNEITRLFRRGYRDADRVLRPALVEVNAQATDPSSVEESTVHADPSGGCLDDSRVEESEESKESEGRDTSSPDPSASAPP